MADPQLMDRAFQRIMRSLVETRPRPALRGARAGSGPARRGGPAAPPRVMQAYPIGWLHPETDYIASFPPLNNLPTQYRVTVRGEQRWFAQCGFEATSATWLFPGETVRVDGAVPRLRRPGHGGDARRRASPVDPPGLRRPLNYGFGAVARPVVLSLNGHEPLPVGRACAPLEPVQPGVRGGLHHAARPGRVLRHRDAAGTCWTRTICRPGIRGARPSGAPISSAIGKTSPFWLGTPDPPTS